MFLDNLRNKFAIIQIHYFSNFDTTGVKEAIYNKRTKKLISIENVGGYKGKPNPHMSWIFYENHLIVNGKDPDIEYLTREQYEACWKPTYDHEGEYFIPEHWIECIMYEQDHYGHRPRKVKNPENRYLAKNLPKRTEFMTNSRKMLEIDWAKKRAALLGEDTSKYDAMLDELFNSVTQKRIEEQEEWVTRVLNEELYFFDEDPFPDEELYFFEELEDDVAAKENEDKTEDKDDSYEEELYFFPED